uniref:Uncharacterized protein n=1 Tax=Megaviridae environmental sample TaxID=1737588 RepID=A0A5J6VJN5_9VIRU|nr:MAG: hypothetical protein [Megaviridae environmental sample]
MKIRIRFDKIFTMLIDNVNDKDKLINLLDKLYCKIKNEELILCLIKILIIIIYKNIDNLIKANTILYFIINDLDINTVNKILNFFKNIDLSKQFLISDKILEQISLNSLYLLENCDNDIFKVWYKILSKTKNVKIKSLNIKCVIYTTIIKDLHKFKNTTDSLKYIDNTYTILNNILK